MRNCDEDKFGVVQGNFFPTRELVCYQTIRLGNYTRGTFSDSWRWFEGRLVPLDVRDFGSMRFFYSLLAMVLAMADILSMLKLLRRNPPCGRSGPSNASSLSSTSFCRPTRSSRYWPTVLLGPKVHCGWETTRTGTCSLPTFLATRYSVGRSSTGSACLWSPLDTPG